MTISSEICKITYLGDGATAIFPIPFYFLANDEVKVIHADEDAVEAVWSEGTHYILTGAGLPGGGTVTVAIAPSDFTPENGTSLTIKRDLDLVQETDYPEGGQFPASAHEQALDRIVMLLQQMNEEIARALKIPTSDVVGTEVEASSASARAQKIVCYDDDGNLTESALTIEEVEAGAIAASEHAADAASSAVIASGFAAVAGAAASTAVASASAAAGAAGAVKVSADDTTPSDLESKLLVGTGLDLATQTPGGNETRTISLSLDELTSAAPALNDKLVGVDTSSGDANAAFLVSDIMALATGRVVQVVNTQTGSLATGTTTIPIDDTIPQNTEGTEFMSLAITPTNASNKLIIEVIAVFSIDNGSIQECCGALFQDNIANAIASQIQRTGGISDAHVWTIRHFMTAGTASATTFKFRMGSASAATINFNGYGGSRKHGGVLASSITITEIAS